MRKTWVVLLILIVVFFAAGVYTFSSLQKQAIENVQVTISEVQVQSIGLTTAKLNIKLNINNPSGIGITIDRVNYTLYGNNILIGNGAITEKLNVAPRSTSNASSLFEFSYSGALQALWRSIVSGEKIEWKVNGTAYINTPLGTLTIPFSSNLSK